MQDKPLLERITQELNEYWMAHIKDCNEYLKGDIGKLNTDTDPLQTKSFTRGKLTGFIYSKDKFNELAPALLKEVEELKFRISNYDKSVAEKVETIKELKEALREIVVMQKELYGDGSGTHMSLRIICDKINHLVNPTNLN